MTAAELRSTLHKFADLLASALERPAETPADELVPLSKCGIELKAAQRLVREGRLPAVRLGRVVYTRRAALLDLCPEAGSPEVDPSSPAESQPDPLFLAAEKRARRLARKTAKAGDGGSTPAAA